MKKKLKKATGLDWVGTSSYAAHLKGIGIYIYLEENTAFIKRTTDRKPFNSAQGDDPVEAAVEIIDQYRKDLKLLLNRE